MSSLSEHDDYTNGRGRWIEDAIGQANEQLSEKRNVSKQLPGSDGPAPTDRRAPLEDRFLPSNTSVESWLSREGHLAPVPERWWLIHDLFVQGITVLFSARGGMGKSFLTISLAISVATGRSFARFRVRRPRRVVLISREDDRRELQIRFDAAVRALFPDGLDSYTAQLLRENLHLVDLFGVVDAAMGEELLSMIVEHHAGAGLIVLDPLSKLLPDMEHSITSTEGAAAIHRWSDRIARETGATVLLVHHHNKDSAKAGRPNAGSSTGSQQLEDLARCVIGLGEPDSDQRDSYGLDRRHPRGYVELRLVKTNYTARLGDPVVFERAEGGALVSIHVTPKSTRTELVLDALREADSPVTADELKARLKGRLGENQVDKERAALVERGLVDRTIPNEGTHLYSLAEEPRGA